MRWGQLRTEKKSDWEWIRYLKRENVWATGPDNEVLLIWIYGRQSVWIRDFDVQASVGLCFDATVSEFENSS